MNQESIASRVFTQYEPLINADIESYTDDPNNFCLPFFSEKDILSLCQQAKFFISQSPIMLELKSSVVVVGDLHGQILDLFRILKEFGRPIEYQYLFLGDIVDRGEFSLETATLIFALRVLYPRNVYIIRGNHEFHELCSRCGFLDEIISIYGSNEVYNAFIECFNYLPLLSLIDDEIICVHGGIGPSWFSFKQTSTLKRPIFEFHDQIVSAIVWSDPSHQVEEFGVSPRGTGHLFGESALTEFLHLNSKKLLVRGHECVEKGCEYMLNNQIVTVFSASNYCGMCNNLSGVFIVRPNHQYEIRTFPPLPYIKRNKTQLQRKVMSPAMKRRSSTSSFSIPIMKPTTLQSFSSSIPKNTDFKKISESKSLRASPISNKSAKPGVLTKRSSVINFTPPH